MTSIKQVLKFETSTSRSVNKDYNLTGNVHFAKYFVTVDNDGERFLALVLFHVSTCALFYKAQSNQSQKETNVPYPTPNQTKLAIFTKHSNGNINTSCCGCQSSSLKTRMGVLGTSQTKTWVVRAHPSRQSS